jgi:membrane protein
MAGTGEGARTGATEVARKVLSSFPARVWFRFLERDGFLLSAGLTYYALFACFSGIYVAFAVSGLWLGGSSATVTWLIDVVNRYIPNLISKGGSLLTPDRVRAIAAGSRGTLAVTGSVAIVVGIWMSIGFVTFSRRALCDIFGITIDLRDYVIMKVRDVIAAVAFALALLIGFAVTSAGTQAVGMLFHSLGWDEHSGIYQTGVALASILVSFVLYTFALATLMRFLTRTLLSWRLIRQGALIGGGAVTLLQVAASWLLRIDPTNPLMATFAVLVGLLLWFHLIGIILLVAAAWIAVAAEDAHLPLLPPTEVERLIAEHGTLLQAARDQLMQARKARELARWWQARGADRAVRDAVDALHKVEAAAPKGATRR